jgi:tripartite-type tricarboxylate transporter receptor subunit TctC
VTERWAWLLALIAAGGAHAAAPAGAEQRYPVKPIRLIVGQAPGGSNDTMARQVGHFLAPRLGKQVIVDNRPGADAVIGTDLAARSAPDGYTLLLASSAYTMNPAVRKLPYDPHQAFDWVALLGSGAISLSIGPSLPVNSVKELIALAKAKPGHLTMGSAGGFQHFVHMLFNNLAGTDITILLYRGGFPALIDVMGGQAHMTIGSIVNVLPHYRSGKLRGLATGGAKRAAILPEVPTLAEAGVPGYDASNWWSIAAPAGTPPAVIALLNAHIAAYLRLPETLKKFTDEGNEVDIRTPEELRKMVAADIAKWAKIAKAAGMRAE